MTSHSRHAPASVDTIHSLAPPSKCRATPDIRDTPRATYHAHADDPYDAYDSTSARPRVVATRPRPDRPGVRPLDVEELARGAHMSADHLSRQFRLAYGESPYGYLMTRRVERAMALLRRGDLSVTDVCFAVGCASLGTFSTRFTELVGEAPSTDRDHGSSATSGIPSCVAKR